MELVNHYFSIPHISLDPEKMLKTIVEKGLGDMVHSHCVKSLHKLLTAKEASVEGSGSHQLILMIKASTKNQATTNHLEPCHEITEAPMAPGWYSCPRTQISEKYLTDKNIRLGQGLGCIAFIKGTSEALLRRKWWKLSLSFVLAFSPISHVI